jgi:type IV secretory pathway TraG/TraD family ATPase VirD4
VNDINRKKMTCYIIQIPSDFQSNPQLKPLIDVATSKNGMMIGVLITAMILVQVFSGGDKKGKIARGYLGGLKEKRQAASKAKKQMKAITRNEVSLYVGCPQQVKEKLHSQWQAQGLIDAKAKPPKAKTSTLFVPDAQRGTSVLGAAGSGKTFSVIDPLVRSALDQGFPTVVYDFKYPAQTKRAVAYAMKRGYTVRVFAPGFPESEVCNPLDLIKDEEDAIAAGQLAQVINKNFNKGGDKGDKFFEEAGDSLVEGILLVTKAVGRLEDPKYCDLMMSQAILSLTSLPQRLQHAASNGTISVWASRPLSQLFGVMDSEKTVAGIVGSAARLFMRFMKKDFIGAFCGQTTLPLDLDGKQLLIFGLARNNRDIVGPLLAAILHMVVSRNVSRTVPRKDPLVTVLDELPTLYLPQLVNWLNENREDGFCGILGYQNIAQLEQFYSKELARAIFGGTANKFIFNPQDGESAKIFADYLGEEEVEFSSKSKSTGSKGGSSKSTSQQRQKRYLVEPSEFLKLRTGRAVVINPAFIRGQDAYVPMLTRIKVPDSDIKEQNWAMSKWEGIRQKLIQRNGASVSDEERTRQFEERRALAEKLFPIPQDNQDLSEGF